MAITVEFDAVVLATLKCLIRSGVLKLDDLMAEIEKRPTLGDATVMAEFLKLLTDE